MILLQILKYFQCILFQVIALVMGISTSTEESAERLQAPAVETGQKTPLILLPSPTQYCILNRCQNVQVLRGRLKQLQGRPAIELRGAAQLVLSGMQEQGQGGERC